MNNTTETIPDRSPTVDIIIRELKHRKLAIVMVVVFMLLGSGLFLIQPLFYIKSLAVYPLGVKSIQFTISKASQYQFLCNVYGMAFVLSENLRRSQTTFIYPGTGLSGNTKSVVHR